MISAPFNRQAYADKTIESAGEALANAKHGDFYILSKAEMKRIREAFHIMRKRYYGDTFMMWQSDESTAVKK